MMVEPGYRNKPICRAWQVLHWVHGHLLQLFVFLIISVPLSDCNESVKRQLMPNPTYMQGTNNITVREGDMAVLPCTIKHLGTKKVAWRKVPFDSFLTIGKTTWVKDANLMVEHKMKQGDITTWDLLIKNVKPKDAGTYECQITSTQEFAYHVQLNVVGPPITQPDHLNSSPEGRDNLKSEKRDNLALATIDVSGKDYVEYGEEITLTCNATGGPHIPEEIDWFKDGDKIDSQKYRNIYITKYRSLRSQSMISELHIERSNSKDTGTYICRSSQDVIDSIKVTVLIADTTNVKRGTGSQIHPLNQAGSSISRYAKTSQILSLSLSLLFLQSVL